MSLGHPVYVRTRAPECVNPMGHMGQEQDRGSRRNDFPELALWVDVLRDAFGPEAGGRLVYPDGSSREWGDPPVRVAEK